MTRKLLEKYGSLHVADSNTDSDIEVGTENILSDFFNAKSENSRV